MAFSATLANNRKLISDAEHRRILNLFSRAGLSMDHPQFDEELLEKGTAAIMKTRDGLLRAAVPNPIGKCIFLNDVSAKEMNAALSRHKQLMQEYPRNGAGIEAFVDASDTGYTDNSIAEQKALETATAKAGTLNGHGVVNGGTLSNGHLNGTNGVKNGLLNGHVNGEGLTNGANGFTNGAKA